MVILCSLIAVSEDRPTRWANGPELHQHGIRQPELRRRGPERPRHRAPDGAARQAVRQILRHPDRDPDRDRDHDPDRDPDRDRDKSNPARATAAITSVTSAPR